MYYGKYYCMKYISKKLFICAILLVLLGISNVSAQGNRDLSSFEGRDFRVVFMQNEVSHPLLADPIQTLDLYISSILDAKVTVVGPGKNETIDVLQNTMQKISFDRSAVLNESEIINSRSIHITSDVPITIYGLNSINASSDIFSAVPVKNWGNEYVVMSYPNDIYRGYTDIPLEQANKPRKSQFAVVSAYDNTVVSIKPTVETNGGRQAGREFSVTLNAGQTYLVQSSDVTEGGDLTGTLIRSDKPIGAFSGHVRTGIYQTLPYPWASKDHLTEMLMPVSSWGQHYITMPFEFTKQTNATLYRITTRTNNTTINITTASGRELTYLIESNTDCLTVDSLNEPAIWTSDAPIQIMEYMRHDGSGNDNKLYDPSMSGVPPVEQYVPKIMFQVPANAAHIPKQYVGHTSMLIVEDKAVNNIRCDGKLLIETTNISENRIANSKYYSVRVALSSGNHVFYADSGRFSGVLYGYGEADSYSVVMGSSLLPMTMVDTVPPAKKIDTLCGHITGYFYEKIDETANSGLDFAYVDKILTMNCDYSLGEQSDSSTYYTFVADVIDDSKEAFIEIVCRDRAGNLSTIEHRFYPMNMKYSHDKLSLEAIDWKGTASRNLWVRNSSKKAYRLLSIVSNNPKVEVVTDNDLPILLDGNGGQYDFRVVITPNSDFADIRSQLHFEFECDKSHDIDVNAKVTATELVTRGYDFGDVIVGQDSCAEIMITNTGKADVVLNSIEATPDAPEMAYDTTGIFPVTLKSGDTLWIPVCFSPIEKGRRVQEVAFKYGSDGSLSVEVAGNGIQSELANIEYDFGICRLGTTNEHNFTLTNTGNVTANVRYFRMETESDEFDISEFRAMNQDVAGAGKVRFSVAYVPKNVGEYSLKAYYILDNDTTKKYSMTLRGEGVIPAIETEDHHVGEITIFTTKDTTLRIVRSSGSEKLSVESVRVTGGHTDSFVIGLDNAQNRVLANGEFIEVPVHFAPQFVGVHTVELTVISDAAENYEKIENRFTISGISRAVDTTNYAVDVIAPSEVIACNEYQIVLRVTNTGNVNTSINAVDVSVESEIAGEWAESYAFPMEIAPREVRDFVYDFTPLGLSDGTFRFNVEVAKYAPREYVYEFVAITNPLTLEPINEISYNPGDTVTVKFAGAFPNGSTMPTDAKLRIYTDRFAFRLIDGEYLLKFEINNEKNDIPLVCEQKNGYFDVPLLGNSMIEGAGLSWSIDLDFQTYLADKRDNPIYFEFLSDECFISANDSANTKLLGVCAYDTRPIELTNAPIVDMKYDYNSDAVNINIENFTDNARFNFTLIESTGKVIKSFEAVLAKGHHQLAFDMSNFAQGAYMLNADDAIYKNNILFIKLK